MLLSNLTHATIISGLGRTASLALFPESIRVELMKRMLSSNEIVDQDAALVLTGLVGLMSRLLLA